MSAHDRREEILEAAMTEFSVKGLHGTSTETIARRAGVSQPYLFRLFGTKKGLYLATVTRGFGQVEELFRRAAEDQPDAALESMGAAYGRLLSQRVKLLGQLQAYAACDDPEVRHLVRTCFGDLYRFVGQISGESEEKVREFFAYGMLLTVAAAIDLPKIFGETWIAECLGVKR